MTIEKDYKKPFGERLKAERIKRCWSLNDLAEKVGDGTVSNTVSRWENGEHFPNTYCRKRLCEVLNTSSEKLFPEYLEEVMRRTKIRRPPPVPRTSSVRFQSVFYFNLPFPGRDEFYGRKRELEPVFGRLENKGSISFVGPRKIGKTWLLRNLQDVVPTELGEHYRVGYIDSTEQKCQTNNGLVDTILHELGIAPSEDLSRDDPLMRLGTALEQLSEKVFVLCIDEFEGLCASKEFDEHLLMELRALATNRGLRIVTASRDSLFNLIKNRLGKTSPFFNIFEQVQLEPFGREEAGYFATEKGKQAGFTEQDREYLLELAQLNENQQEWYCTYLQLIGQMPQNKDKQEWYPPLYLQCAGQMLQEDQHFAKYRPDDPDYWQKFRERLSWQLRGIMS
jgi:transcriptional regulator with XRE-family HTH domain